MVEGSDKATKWSEWKVWKTFTLQTNREYPELGLLTLNRPDKFNTVNADMISDLNDGLDFLKRAFDCRVVIVNGNGKIFCGGLDLSLLGMTKEPVYEWEKFQDRIKKICQMQEEISSIFVKLRRIPQPVIAAVHGTAVGIGMALANAADIVVAGSDARFINAPVKIGVSGADVGSSFFLPRTLGFHRSNELLYSGRDFHAEEAYQWGYVNRLVEKNGEVLDAAVKFAVEMMLTKSTLGLRFTKEAINLNMDSCGFDEVIGFENRAQLLAGESADLQEGVKAFFEKRKPEYNIR